MRDFKKEMTCLHPLSRVGVIGLEGKIKDFDFKQKFEFTVVLFCFKCQSRFEKDFFMENK